MSLARNLARLFPNASGLLPNANIEAMAASKLTGQVPDANAPSGSVIQVVQFESTSSFSTTSTSFTDATGFSASITPSSATSKILLLLSAFTSNTGASQYTWTRLLRGGNVVIPDMVTVDYATFGANGRFITGSKLDSPNTTSPVTYQIQIKAESGTARIGMGSNGSTGVGATVITLMEIAA
jgi:hypothetical protein